MLCCLRELVNSSVGGRRQLSVATRMRHGGGSSSEELLRTSNESTRQECWSLDYVGLTPPGQWDCAIPGAVSNPMELKFVSLMLYDPVYVCLIPCKELLSNLFIWQFV